MDVLQAMGWGLAAALALPVGAAIGLRWRLRAWQIAAVMAFGAGALISSLTYELVAEAYDKGGLDASFLGLTAGALLFFAGDLAIDRRGGRHRKRSKGMQQEDAGTALLLGAVLDGIPESIVIGISIAAGGSMGYAFVIAVLISNLPEGLSSATGMRKVGYSARRIMIMWFVVAAVSAMAAGLGALMGDAPDHVVAALDALAGGAILTMLADTMMPEAFDEAGHRPWIGLVTVLGFAVGALLGTV
jgi:zinc transporter, ZIP family